MAAHTGRALGTHTHTEMGRVGSRTQPTMSHIRLRRLGAFSIVTFGRLARGLLAMIVICRGPNERAKTRILQPAYRQFFEHRAVAKNGSYAHPPLPPLFPLASGAISGRLLVQSV